MTKRSDDAGRLDHFRLGPTWRRGVCVAGAALVLSGFSPAPEVLPLARAPEVRLSGDRITIPITMVREFPMIEGEVNGVHGHFMFDSGSAQALALNDHLVSMPGGETISKGHFGSGETFVVRLNRVVPSVRVGPLRFSQVTDVASQDGRQLEKITPDFLGFVGYDFWKGYALELDY